MTKHQQSTEPQSGTAKDMVREQEATTDNIQGGSKAADATGYDFAPEQSSAGDGANETVPSDTDASVTEGEPQSAEGGVSPREAELEAKLQDTEARLKRALADFDNFRRRTRQEHEDLQKYAARKVLEGLLPVVDNFERALTALEGKDVQEELQTGVEMVYRQLQNVLTQQGVIEMDAVGKPFDPQIHEAVMQEPAEGQEAGIVLQELQKGYLLHDKVLRPAMVKVSV